MKKILGGLLILMLILAMVLTGCGGSDSESEADQTQSSQSESSDDAVKEADSGGVNTEGMGDLLSAAYVEMMKSSEYLMKYKATMDADGQSMEVEATLAVKGDDTAMISNIMGAESTIVMKDDKVYMIDHASKTVIAMPQSAGDAVSMDTGTIDTEGITYLGSGNEGGLAFEEYATAGGKMKYYFDGKDLVKIAVLVEGQTIVMEILEMSKDVPAGMFEIPTGYQLTEM